MIEIHSLDWMNEKLGTRHSAYDELNYDTLFFFFFVSSRPFIAHSFVRFSFIDFQLWKSIAMNYILSIVAAFYKLNILWIVIWKAVKIKLNNSNISSMVKKEKFHQLLNKNTIYTILSPKKKRKSFRQ